MSHTYFAVHVHVVFSTKDRRPLLSNEIQQELFPYLAGVAQTHESQAYIVGGHVDHIHALLSPGSMILIPNLVREMKRASSRWLKTKGEAYRDFAWQEGYGAFSVSQSNLVQVTQYIKFQHRHHKTYSFEEEYRRLLAVHNFAFDEKHFLG
ncbi:MAG: IS200/IS605 family transposase [Candidatus Hydrogenedens sp.]|nr:IS200/IS605 family transposase [Candidatus Hydrogenedens sp.]